MRVTFTFIKKHRVTERRVSLRALAPRAVENQQLGSLALATHCKIFFEVHVISM